MVDAVASAVVATGDAGAGAGAPEWGAVAAGVLGAGGAVGAAGALGVVALGALGVVASGALGVDASGFAFGFDPSGLVTCSGWIDASQVVALGSFGGHGERLPVCASSDHTVVPSKYALNQ